MASKLDKQRRNVWARPEPKVLRLWVDDPGWEMPRITGKRAWTKARERWADNRLNLNKPILKTGKVRNV